LKQKEFAQDGPKSIHLHARNVAHDGPKTPLETDPQLQDELAAFSRV
jgi:hypothetical protein